jgi:hypothetical protein
VIDVCNDGKVSEQRVWHVCVFAFYGVHTAKVPLFQAKTFSQGPIQGYPA